MRSENEIKEKIVFYLKHIEKHQKLYNISHNFVDAVNIEYAKNNIDTLEWVLEDTEECQSN